MAEAVDDLMPRYRGIQSINLFNQRELPLSRQRPTRNTESTQHGCVIQKKNSNVNQEDRISDKIDLALISSIYEFILDGSSET